MSNWTVICDFDGTIATSDVTDQLLERFAAPEWRIVEMEWLAGRIGSRQCLQQQTELLRATRGDLTTFLPQVEIDTGFPDFVAAVQVAGYDIRIASEGFSQVIRALLARSKVLGLTVAGTYLMPAGPDSWVLGFPYSDPECSSGAATCKCAVAANATSRNQRVLLVGDGQSDYCLAEKADMVFAKGRLLEYCQTRGLPHIAVDNFREALAQLNLLDQFGTTINTGAAAPGIQHQPMLHSAALVHA